jgi:valyl-tRNA synthetase
MTEESKIYDPKLVEEKIYKTWEASGFFNPDNLENAGENYIVYMPLPNVTGTLHMGHLLNNTIQDVLIRYERMRGKRALYLPGTDHAGIATQFVVEKELKKQGINRFELGREKFIEKVWEWKEKYGNLILEQLRKIGISADWSRLRFTMDPAYGKDVLAAFVHYYERGWLYQGRRTVNWCHRCGTSLSELELEYKDEKATLYYMKYGPFTLATTRPETKFGDTALAVNPKDERYQKYIGETLEADSLETKGSLDTPGLKKVKLQIVGDEAVDITFGTGVVKVTPAHDLVDFEIGQRHKLPTVQVIDERGRMTEITGKYAGLKTTEARKKVVADMKATGLLLKEEPYDHRIAVCYRCGTTIEPIPSNQWFLKMEELSKKAKEAVKNGKVKIQPENFEKTYLTWLENIRDWTVSRQIWWGHRLPVWHCETTPEKFMVAIEKPEKCSVCGHCAPKQSEDVLDTWFSSALWPFAGFSESDLKKYYPGNALITARDILNLWVARMIFSGLEFKGTAPFTRVFIHGTILTKDGKRMSKSLGTGIDPLTIIEKYGADAARFAIVWQASGQDIHWDEAAVMAGRKFGNKIWNASRFVLEKIGNGKITINGKLVAKTEADSAILEKLAAIRASVGTDIENFEFSKAIHDIYDFFWHDFCDKYLEESKDQLNDEKIALNTKTILLHIVGESLKMLHPFMPFITEEIYGRLPMEPKAKLLMVERYN